MVTILECKTAKNLRQFERAGESILAGDPYYVPPFPGSVTKLIGPKSLLRQHGKILPLLALDGGRVVGRIAAIRNEAHNAYYGDRVGFFGFFDFVDRADVSKLLLERAREQLEAWGLERMRGPYNPTVNDECGLLVEGHEAIPSVMMTYNPPYYERHYQELGLEPARDLGAYYMRADVDSPERIQRVVNRVKKRTGITFRHINFKNLESEIEILTRLYNQTLDRNWGFVPITQDDMRAGAEDLKNIVDPKMVIIAEKGGEAVGFSLTLPNINEFLWEVRHLPRWLRVLKFVWRLKTGHPKEARLAVLGVAPEFRNKGIAPVFYQETLERAGHNYVGGEMSWVEESNVEMIKAIELMGGHRYKNYRIFEAGVGEAG